MRWPPAMFSATCSSSDCRSWSQWCIFPNFPSRAIVGSYLFQVYFGLFAFLMDRRETGNGEGSKRGNDMQQMDIWTGVGCIEVCSLCMWGACSTHRAIQGPGSCLVLNMNIKPRIHGKEVENHSFCCVKTSNELTRITHCGLSAVDQVVTRLNSEL